MGARKNLIGKKFGRLTVLSFIGRIRSNGKSCAWFWKCLCSCGKEVKVRTSHLQSGSITSCGCFRLERVTAALFKDVSGKTFGRLTAIDYFKKNGLYYWNCKCACGNTTVVRSTKLINSTRSCGCLTKEAASRHMLTLIKRQKGKNHPRWNPKLSDSEREKRIFGKGEEHRLSVWRNSVYARDKYACKKCGDAVGHNLNAHHIYSRNSHPKLTYVVKNGITMCNVCHKEFHHLYGYGNNTKKQLAEYFQ